MNSLLFDIANFIVFVGTLLQIKAVVQNRNILRGYDLLGSILTFLAILLFQTGFGLAGFLVSILFGIPTMIYWLLVSLYLVKLRLRNE